MSPFRFCPTCGHPFAPAEGLQPQHCQSCGNSFFHNSKPCAGVVIEEEGKILLGKRGAEPFLGYWDIIGGFLEPGEHPEEGARREVREETGLEVELTGCLGLYVDTYGESSEPTLNVYYTGRPIGGTLKPASDAIALEWFGSEQIPERLAFQHAVKVIECWRAHRSTSPEQPR